MLQRHRSGSCWNSTGRDFRELLKAAANLQPGAFSKGGLVFGAGICHLRE